MAREIALSFALGARLQSGFTAAFQSASSQAKAVSQAIRDMERTPVGKIGAAMSTQQEKIRGLSGSLKDARGELDGLWQRASQAGTMTTVMARQIEQAEARVRRLSGAPSDGDLSGDRGSGCQYERQRPCLDQGLRPAVRPA